jgi:NhaA family Na+:H+ antiporter
VAVLKSGAHATLAGVILAFFIPIRSPGGEAGESRNLPSPLKSLEHALHPWVALGILPVFAFANAGVPMTGVSVADLLHPVPLGIALGLVLGKLVGVLAASWLAVRLGLASLPDEVRWPHMVGVSLLCGIGFTMSLFIASLAFEEADLSFNGLDRLGILTGSLVAGVLGYALLRTALGGKTAGS